MKLLIILSLLVSVSTGCKTIEERPTISVTSPADTVVENTLYTIPAWGADKHKDWTAHLYNEIMKSKIPDNTKTPCKRISAKMCLFQLISITAKHESNFKPETSYNETGHLAGVVSRGLLQISKDSANGYGCNINNAKELHDPFVNLSCGVKIFERWAIKDGVFIGEYPCVKDGKKTTCYLGGSRYWSVLRSTKSGKPRESYNNIKKWMDKY